MLQKSFIHHDTIDITDDLLTKVINHDWTKFKLKRLSDPYFAKCQCIYYNFNPVADHIYGKEYDDSDLALLKSTYYILDHLNTIWPNHRFIKGEVSHCPPGVKQGRHRDGRTFHKLSHRVHIPITTNEQCFLETGGESAHLKQGEIWTFNNLAKHSSRNEGITSRVHLVIDVMDNAVFDEFISKNPEILLYELRDGSY